ncbi:MAG: regulatory protein ArsR [Deltaproteobacteria bacterium CSP1-8]|jgi:ArsR family transcriptional regulator|nr:MAG: regulatory protein ArsR [candidate division NC10 bacterium CSP1-5]KRT72130.1 MAG: regulatory protein ArsR [Deltaproteobacteria bacterium CSP1-8]
MDPNMEHIQIFFKLIGDSSRLKILSSIGTVEKTVSEIIGETGLPQTLVSFHLKILREHQIVQATRKGGPFVYYRLQDPSLVNLLDACDTYARRLKGGAMGDVPDFEWPPWKVMCRMMRRGRR